MESKGLKLRWVYGACYEIVLPNGKVIITDPYITPNDLDGFTIDDITGADYILCSHTHYDHTADIAALIRKFSRPITSEMVQTPEALQHSKLIIGSMAAPHLAECFDMDYVHIYPASDGTVYDFEDFELRTFSAKHVSSPAGRAVPSRAVKVAEERFGVKGHGECDRIGWIEELDFVITTRNNIRIMIVSGMPVYNNPYKVAEKVKPNIVIRQFFGPPEFYGKILAPFNAQIYLPNHHEHIKEQTGYDIESYTAIASGELSKMDPVARLLDPVPRKWYDLSLRMDLSKE